MLRITTPACGHPSTEGNLHLFAGSVHYKAILADIQAETHQPGVSLLFLYVSSNLVSNILSFTQRCPKRLAQLSVKNQL